MIWDESSAHHTNTRQMAERLHLLENSPRLTEVLHEQVQNVDQRMYSITFTSIRKGNKTKEGGSDVDV